MATKINSRLVSGTRLLELNFEKEGRPSLRTLRNLQKRGVVPYYKVGRLVLFDPAEVRNALAVKCHVLVKGPPPCGYGSALIAGVTHAASPVPTPETR